MGNFLNKADSWHPISAILLNWDSLGMEPRKLNFYLFIIYLFIYLFIFGCVGSSVLCKGFL